MIIKCKICNKEFKIKPSRLKYGKKFCSLTCYAKARKIYYSGQNSYNWKGGKIEKICIICNKKFGVEKNALIHSACKYCSMKCRNIDYKQRMKNENNPFWNGGKSFEPYGMEFNEELKNSIRNRDNYTCQNCNFMENQLGYKLSVHHIDFNKKNNTMNNLISLCKTCHGQTQYRKEDWIKYYQNKIQRF